MENNPIETCVVCLRISQEGNFQTLTTCDMGNTETDLSKIRTLLGVEVFDKFSLICSYCKEDLNMAYEFRERLVHAHEYWSSNKHAVKQDRVVKASEENIALKDIKQEPPLSTEHDISPEENEVKLERGGDEDAMAVAWKGLRCIKCKEVFRTALVLSNHNCNGPTDQTKEHLRNKKHVCEYCSESFKWRQSLINHLLNKHSNARNFSCDACGKTFKIKASLTRHMEVHQPHRIEKPKEDPIMCNVCGKSYSKQNLRKHMKIHNDVKPHECEVCGKKFRQSDQLKVHLRTHTGKRPYVCGECGDCFMLNATLQKHIGIKHNNGNTDLGSDAVIQTY